MCARNPDGGVEKKRFFSLVESCFKFNFPRSPRLTSENHDEIQKEYSIAAINRLCNASNWFSIPSDKRRQRERKMWILWDDIDFLFSFRKPPVYKRMMMMILKRLYILSVWCARCVKMVLCLLFFLFFFRSLAFYFPLPRDIRTHKSRRSLVSQYPTFSKIPSSKCAPCNHFKS